MALSQTKDTGRPEFRRLVVDVTVLSGLGRFFADKLRAGVAYALYVRTHELGRLRQAVDFYQKARTAWVGIVQATHGVYRDDITFGLMPNVRGSWTDRLPGIDADLHAMEAELIKAESAATRAELEAADKIGPLAVLDRLPPSIDCSHVPAAHFTRGEPVAIDLAVDANSSVTEALSARLFYRHVNQAESYCISPMERVGERYRAIIPSSYTDSPYALQYLIELRDDSERAWFYPGLSATLDTQPYFVVPQFAP